MNQTSYLSEIQTKVENTFNTWHLSWLGKIICSPVTYFILFYLCIASNEFYWQVHVYNSTNQQKLRYFSGGDTNSYTCCKCNLLKGETDQFRTPGYPLFLKCISRLCSNETIRVGSDVYDEENRLIEDNCNILVSGWIPYCAVVTMQLLINLLAFVFFFYASKELIKNSVLHLLIMAYFAKYFMLYHFWIMTESLAISGVLCFFSLLVFYLKQRNALIAGTMSAIVLILVMLRPFFIFLTVLLFFFWTLRIVLYKQERLSAGVGLLCLFFSCIAIHGYCELNKKNHGEYELTSVSTMDRFVILYRTSLYEKGNDTEIVDFISNFKNTKSDDYPYSMYWKVCKNFGYSRLKAFVNSTTKDNLCNFVITTIKRMYWEKYEFNYINY